MHEVKVQNRINSAVKTSSLTPHSSTSVPQKGLFLKRDYVFVSLPGIVSACCVYKYIGCVSMDTTCAFRSYSVGSLI